MIGNMNTIDIEGLMKKHGMTESSPLFQSHLAFFGNPQVHDATDHYDSSLVRRIFLQTYQEAMAEENSMSRTAKYTYDAIDSIIAPSPLEDLKQVYHTDVVQKVNHLHAGSVLLLEVVHVPYHNALKITLLVKDSNNDEMILDLYNHVAPDNDPKEFFPKGKKFALLCPFLHNFQDDRRKHLVLRRDNPQFIVSQDDERYIWKEKSTVESKNPSELRLSGNQHFQNGNLEQASNCYSQALMHADIDIEAFASDKVSCLSNRAEVNLRQERWYEAVKDAQEVLKIQADHGKAKFRLAKAWSRIGKASDALALLKQLRKNGGALSRSKELQALVKDSQRIAKEELGDFDISSMLKEASKKPGERLSSFHATFCSSKIAIGVPINDNDSYRGCKALSDIKEGELIMSSKAFAMGRQLPEGVVVESNSMQKSLDNTPRTEMVSEIVRKLWKTPSLGKKVYSLTNGDPSRPSMDDETMDKIDLARIRDIVRCNSFLLGPYDVGIQEIWEHLKGIPPKDPPTSCAQFGGGIWINESMLNNSCSRNCTWATIADQIFIRTTKPIQKGEELCIAYHTPFDEYEKRWHKFGDWVRPGVGFECVCDHCELGRNRADLRKLVSDISDGFRSVQALETSHGSRATAGQMVFPSSRRHSIFQAFSGLPLRLHHIGVFELYDLEGWIRLKKGDLAGSLKAFQHAVDIYHGVRGSGSWQYFEGMWYIAGLAIVCKQHDVANESLVKIWNASAFQAYPRNEAEAMFRDLTQFYALQKIGLDPQYAIPLNKLIRIVLKG